MNDLDLSAIPDDGDLVLRVPCILTGYQADQIRKTFDAALPGRKVIVLDNGMKLERIGQSEQLDRIEAKLDFLLATLPGAERGTH